MFQSSPPAHSVDYLQCVHVKKTVCPSSADLICLVWYTIPSLLQREQRLSIYREQVPFFKISVQLSPSQTAVTVTVCSYHRPFQFGVLLVL